MKTYIYIYTPFVRHIYGDLEDDYDKIIFYQYDYPAMSCNDRGMLLLGGWEPWEWHPKTMRQPWGFDGIFKILSHVHSPCWLIISSGVTLSNIHWG
jgi:hypothetical protein